MVKFGKFNERKKIIHNHRKTKKYLSHKVPVHWFSTVLIISIFIEYGTGIDYGEIPVPILLPRIKILAESNSSLFRLAAVKSL